MIIQKQVKLKNGKKLIVRTALPTDAKEAVEYLNIIGGESNNLLFGKNEFRLNEEQEAEHIERVNNDPNSIMIVATVEDKLVSIALLRSPERKRIAHVSEFSISVKKEYWNLGIGSYVMEQLINFAKQNETIKVVSLGVRSDNENAIKLYEKFGFKKIGTHKNYFNIDGDFYDEILMDLHI